MFFAIFKKLTGFDPAAILIAIFLAMIAVVLVPNAGKVLGFFGYETRAVLKEKLNDSQQSVAIAADANKTIQNTVKIREATGKIIEDALVTKASEDKLILKATDEIKVKKQKKIETITIDPQKTQTEKDKEISEVQITSIWDAFCQGNSNPSCSANVAGG